MEIFMGLKYCGIIHNFLRTKVTKFKSHENNQLYNNQ